MTGFEPATSWSQTRRSTKLSYTPCNARVLTTLPSRSACGICSLAATSQCVRDLSSATALPSSYTILRSEIRPCWPRSIRHCGLTARVELRLPPGPRPSLFASCSSTINSIFFSSSFWSACRCSESSALWTRFQWTYLPIMLAIYFWAGISTTLYLHRYLTHRGFEMPGWLKFIFATGSAVALSGDPVTWVGDHRYHHLKSDTDEDIHSPLHGFPYAHMMWLVRKPPGFRDHSLRYAADVRKIWYCRLWERPYFYVLPHLARGRALVFHPGRRRDCSGASTCRCSWFTISPGR